MKGNKISFWDKEGDRYKPQYSKEKMQQLIDLLYAGEAEGGYKIDAIWFGDSGVDTRRPEARGTPRKLSEENDLNHLTHMHVAFVDPQTGESRAGGGWGARGARGARSRPGPAKEPYTGPTAVPAEVDWSALGNDVVKALGIDRLVQHGRQLLR